MKFTFDIHQPQNQYLQITAEFKTSKSQTEIFLPNWRPGRYELGNFAKNVRDFKVFDSNNQPLPFKKSDLNTWIVNNKDEKNIIVQYQYYSAELNAGSTFLNQSQLYVNPVNCCVFTDEQYNEEIAVQLNIPPEWKIAHSLPLENQTFFAKNFDELADSPFICSASLQHKTYEVKGTTFHIWFNGIVKPDWSRLIDDFKRFTLCQVKYFSNIPTKEYHFLFQILPNRAYHGVEHSKSTVICLGPSYKVFEEDYKELLGVSSHELYHTWNVKAIRPIEWMPYNFKQACPSKLGYVAEGVTTYMGDLILLKSGVFTLTQYLVEMNAQLQKHYDNFGRFHYSVADSSYDTWLDGYVQGSPARKVSIYTEGALLAFIADVWIMKQTNNQQGLIEVMRKMYQDFGEKGIGYSEKDYQNCLEHFSKSSMQWLFDDFINGTTDYTEKLDECFNYIGLKIEISPSPSVFAAQLGAKLEADNNVVSVYPDSIIDKVGIKIGDKIIAINGISVGLDIDRWITYFKNEEKELLINRNGKIIRLKLPVSSEIYFKEYKLRLVDNPTEEQLKALESWG